MFYTPYDRQFCHTTTVSDKQAPTYWSSMSQDGHLMQNVANVNAAHQRQASWVHTVPTYMPWANKQNHLMQPGVMRFTASPSVLDPCTSQTATSWELLHNLGQTGGPTGVHPHLKRRSESPENTKPAKQFISEERMAARFNQMHISNEYKAQPALTDSNTSGEKKDGLRKPVRTLEELEEMLAGEFTDESDNEDDKKDSKGGLVLAPEIKKIVDGNNATLTKAMIEEMNKPSMAVVLWQPPGEIIKQTIQAALASSDRSSQNNSMPATSDPEDNNNSCNVDLNTLGSTNTRRPSVFSFATADSNTTAAGRNPFSALGAKDLVQLDQMDEDMDDL